MPLPNFHACRLRDPGRFQDGSIRTFEREHSGKAYNVLSGRLKGEESLTDQSFRYPRKTWTESQARAHCKDHDGKLFEPATGERETNNARHKSILNTPWLLDEGQLYEMVSAIDAPGMLDIDELFGAIGAKQLHEIRGNTGILPISGVITKKESFLQKLFGGASLDRLTVELQALVDNPDVHQVVLDIDSPGGDVDGTFAFAERVHNATRIKPVIAFVNTCACSGAYLVASGSSKIIMADKTAQAGSIGVVYMHRDFSEAEKKAGIKTTEIVAGKFKRIASPHEPLPAEGRKTIQEQVDYIYSLFVGTVAMHRGVTEETVIEKMAEGRIFIGQQAIDAGLADGFGSLDDFQEGGKVAGDGINIVSVPDFDMLTGYLDSEAGKKILIDVITSNHDEVRKLIGYEKKGGSMPTPEKIALTEEYMAKETPQLLEKIKTDAHKIGFEAGVKSERDRVKALRAMTIEGFEDVTNKAIEEGKAPEATSMELIAAVKNRGITPAAIKGDNQPVDHAATDAGGGEQDETQYKAQVDRMVAAANEAVNERE